MMTVQINDGDEVVDREDWECFQRIENERKPDGERRYYVYDDFDDDWCIVARGHAPAHLMSWSFVPAKFANPGAELLYLAKRYVIEHARRVVRDVARKAEWW